MGNEGNGGGFVYTPTIPALQIANTELAKENPREERWADTCVGGRRLNFLEDSYTTPRLIEAMVPILSLRFICSFQMMRVGNAVRTRSMAAEYQATYDPSPMTILFENHPGVGGMTH